jgi:hypothetical protein
MEISMSGQPGRSGRKAFEPTADQRNTVKIMAGLAIPEDQICLAIINPQTRKPISTTTLRRAFRQEINTAQIELHTLVGNALINAALGERPIAGEPIRSDAARMNAMMFYLECRAGWKRGMLLQHSNPTGPNGNAIPFIYYPNKTDAKL